MRAKKTPAADLDNYRTIFRAVGLVLSLLIVIAVFEIKFYDNLEAVSLGKLEDNLTEITELDIPQTQQELPPPKTILEQPEIIEVPDETELINEIEINLNVELNENSGLQKSVYGKGEQRVAIAEAPKHIIEEREEEIFLIVEEKPEPVGGLNAFYEFVNEHLEYPRAARAANVTGRVFVEFVVNTDGSLVDIKIVKGLGFGCDEEALRVFNMAPKWNPGKQRGRAVRVKMTVPILFKLIQ